MNKLIHCIFFVVPFLIVAGCKLDPPLYYTPLPGGLSALDDSGISPGVESEVEWLGLDRNLESFGG